MSDKHPNSRRDFLRTLGVGITITGATTSDTGIRPYRNPPSSAQTTEIPLRTGNVFQLTTTDWPVFRFGWRTERDERQADLEQIRSAAAYSFHIDGTEIADLHEGWDGPTRSEDGGYELTWRYSIPPLPPGNHTADFEMMFPEPLRTSGPQSRVWEGTYSLTDIFGVTPVSNPRTADRRSVFHPPSADADSTIQPWMEES